MIAASHPDGRTRVGVSFIGVRAQMGGFYQHSLSILEELVDLGAGYEIVLFSDDSAVLEQHSHIKERVQIVHVPKGKSSLIANGLRVLYALWGRGSFPELLKGPYSIIDRTQCKVVFHPYWGPAAFVTSTPTVCFIGDSTPRDHPRLMPWAARWQLDFLIRAILRKAKLILVESEWGAELLRTHYKADRSRVRVLPMKPPRYLLAGTSAGTDREILARLGISRQYLFLPGRWDGYKNTKRVLQALRLLRNDGLDPPQLVLSGLKAHELDPARQAIEELRLEDRVTVVGYVRDELMPALYQNAIALVFPTTLGPTSLPVVEAIALGCPVIVSDIPAYPEQAGEAGITVDPYSVESIAAGIRRVVFDEDVHRRLKENARARGAEIRGLDYGERLRAFIREVSTAS
jgi:glycosyltransferase involved in cell wall biosynthesis